jgi:NADPH2:quinone reductase
MKMPIPFSPCGELAGIVSAVGPDVNDFKVGDKVIGITGWGGLRTQVRARVYDQVLRMPENMSFDQACGFITTYGTTYYALKSKA